MGQLKGENRLRSTVLIGPAWREPVAAAAGSDIAEGHTAVVGAEEPGPGTAGVLEPAIVASRRGSRLGGFDRGLRFERLLIERQVGVAALAESFGADRPEMAFGRGLLLRNPLERLQPRADHRLIAQHHSRFDQRLREARIVVAKHRFEPGPVRSARLVEQAAEDLAALLQSLARGDRKSTRLNSSH